MPIRILLTALVLSTLLQILRLQKLVILDDFLWIDQAQYIQTQDPRQFGSVTAAYAHPGAPVTDSTSVIHTLLHVSYHSAFYISMVALCSLLIACIALLCYTVSPHLPWWLIATIILSTDKAFETATPTSSLAALLFILLCLLTVRTYARSTTFLRSCTVGLLLATRIDIGLLSLVFLFFHFKTFRSTAFLAIAVFWLVNPFMWTHPLRHLHDLATKLTYHYAEFDVTHIPLADTLLLSSQAAISFALGLAFVFSPKLPTVFPRRFLLLLLGFTVLQYTVILTSHYQAPRYFLPITLTWQILLPPLLLSLCVNPRFKRVITLALITIPLGLFLIYLAIPYPTLNQFSIIPPPGPVVHR